MCTYVLYTYVYWFFNSEQGSHRPQTPPPVLPPGELLAACNVYSYACEPHCLSLAATTSSLSLCAKMTSFIKPEIRNISLRRQRRTEPRPYVTWTKIFGEDRTCNCKGMMAHRQTHRQTDRHAYRSTPLSYWGRSKYYQYIHI